MRVPNSLQEITIDKYIKAIDIIENEDIDLGIMLRLLNLFTGKSIEQLMEYPLAELDKNYQQIAKVLNEKAKVSKDFLFRWQRVRIHPEFRANEVGRVYRLD